MIKNKGSNTGEIKCQIVLTILLYKFYARGHSDGERLIFLAGCFLFSCELIIIANAFISPFFPDVFREFVLASKGDWDKFCKYKTQQKTDNSFFIRFG